MMTTRPPLFRACLGALALLVAASPALHGQWARTLGGSASDAASFARPTSDGGIIAAGFTASFGAGGEDVWAVKLDASGSIAWQRAYGGPADDRAYVVQEASDGFIVLGWTESFGAGGRDAWILKLDASGNVQWQRAYGGAGFDQGDDIRATPDGGYIAACFTMSAGAGEEDFWFLKLDSAGNVQWQRTCGGAASDLIEHVETTADGGYLATGFTRSFGSGRNDVWVLKLSSVGDILWQRVLGGSGDDIPEYLEKTGDGGFILAGATDSAGAGGYDVLVLKFDSAGTLQWQRTYGGSGADYAEAIRQTADGGYTVGGHTDSFGAGAHDVWGVRLDGSGNILWQWAFGGGGEDFAYSFQPAASGGGFVVAGASRSFGAGQDDVFILRIASDGRVAPACSIGAASGAFSGSPNLAAASLSASTLVSGLADRATAAVPVATNAAVQTLCQAPRYTLQISAGAGGTTGPPPGTSIRDFMEAVLLQALPASGHLFDRWSGDVADSERLANPLTVVMDANRTILANFRAAPRFTLRISAGPGGTTDPAPGTSIHDSMETVSLLALPASGFLFDRWSGDVPEASRAMNPLTLTMNGDKTVQANFRVSVSPPLNLTGRRIGRAAGAGSVVRLDVLAWEPNPANTNAALALYRVYRIDPGGRILLAELPAGVRAFVRAGVPARDAVIYAVTAVTAADGESAAAIVTVGPRPPTPAG